MKRNVFAILLLTVIVLGTSCKPTENPPPARERSYLHILNASEFQGEFDLVFDYWDTDGQVIADLEYQDNWPGGGYANLVAGGEPDEFGNGKLYVYATRQPFINVPIDTVMVPTPIVLSPNVFSTLTIVDSSGTLAIDHFEDNFDAPGNEANIRLLNLREASAKAGLRSTDGSISTGDVQYRGASDFIRVPSGVFDIEITDEDGVTVIASRTNFNLSPGVTYTFFVSGNGSSDLAVFVH